MLLPSSVTRFDSQLAKNNRTIEIVDLNNPMAVAR
jgi:hypothetical protein